jgi:rhamnulokinase
MSTENKFIGFDLGAESGRCVVGILEDEKIVLHEVHRFPTHNIKYANGFYWDVLAIYNEIVQGLINAQKMFGKNFAGISVDTWGVDYVLLDPENRILGYPYHYRDDRTDGIMEEAFKIIPGKALYNKTGIQFAQINTLYQLLSEKKRKVNLLNSAGTILLMPDFFNFMLSGKKNAEFSIASTTNLADPFARKWSRELIKSFDLPEEIFPEIIEPGTRLGNILPSLSEKTGLSPGIPVYACAGHDTASAVASIPVSIEKEYDENWAFLSSGTWSLMGVELIQPVINSKAMQYNFSNEGGVEKTTRFLKNITGLWPVQESRRYWQEKREDYSYNEITSLAQKEGFVGVWVDLNDNRFLKPGKMPEKIRSYLQETHQPVKFDIGFITQVILESLAFVYKKTIEEIEDATGKRINRLHAVGGGIQNQYLIQLTSDATGLKVITGPVEGTIAGNIGMQAIAEGIISDVSTLRKVISNSFEIKTYEPVNSKYFEENEEKFVEILNKKKQI